MTATRVDVRAELSEIIEGLEELTRRYQNMAAMGVVRTAKPGSVVDAFLNLRTELRRVLDG